MTVVWLVEEEEEEDDNDDDDGSARRGSVRSSFGIIVLAGDIVLVLLDETTNADAWLVFPAAITSNRCASRAAINVVIAFLVSWYADLCPALAYLRVLS